MAVKVRIPTPLQPLTQGEPRVTADGGTVRDVLADLETRYPGFKQRLYDESGSLRRFVNVYVNDEDIRFLDGESTALSEADEVSIIPAVAGGSLPTRVRRAVRLTFPQHLITEPVTFRMAKMYDITPNIRRARVTETIGEMVLELEGEEKNVEQGIRYLQDEGVQVTAVEGDILE